jgi:hypothetical protein
VGAEACAALRTLGEAIGYKMSDGLPRRDLADIVKASKEIAPKADADWH